jgi:site-specific DNA-methyltransferase (adenine-specific)
MEYQPLSLIKPYERNPRLNDAAVQAVAKSIERNGFRAPILVDKDNVIICGHTRYKAAKLLGLDSVPVIVHSDMTEKQIKEYRIADNKTGELAQWDFSILMEELEELRDDDIDLKDLGFSEADLLAMGFDDSTTQEDKVKIDDEPAYILHIEFDSEEELSRAFEDAVKRGLKCKIIE